MVLINSEGDFNQKPSFCDLIITEKCLFKCKMCQMWQSKNETSVLDVLAWKRFISSFADFVDGKAQVQFVGGEPMLAEGILELIRHANKKGLFTTMTTNAYLIDAKVAKDIADSGLNTIVFSLDSMKQQTHDFLRGTEGAYGRLMMAIKLLGGAKNNSLRLHLVSTIMQPNLDDLLKLAEWVNLSKAVDNISFQALVQPFFTPTDDNWYNDQKYSFLWPKDIDKVDYILDRLTDLKNRGYKITNPAAQFKTFKAYFRNPERFVRGSRCNLGYNSISVNTAGKIFLCLSLEPIGSIYDNKDIKELWLSEKAVQVTQDIKNCKRNCKLMINCFFEEETAD